ncbi:uncharacterized protein LOC141915529 [Tubulanus polymorphus]|uniref:uncharacterized protein LOC141915529 n=1 Tax=Tubulanus polymorphus TaxID=672921 RepID=UPI003DA668FA
MFYENIPVISVNKPFQTYYKNAEIPRYLDNFMRTGLNTEERSEFESLLKDFMMLAKENNLTFMISDGSLLGAYRHHGMIPWDDDFDIMFPKLQRGKILELFKGKYRNSNLSLWSSNIVDMQWKIFRAGKPFIGESTKWSYPFIDMFHYSEFKGIIRCKQFQFKSADIFPLAKVPFMGSWLPAPGKWGKYLNIVYGKNLMTKCSNLWYLHRIEKHNSDELVTVSCENLQRFVPFVSRSCSSTGVITETLKIGNKRLHVWSYTAGIDGAPVDSCTLYP